MPKDITVSKLLNILLFVIVAWMLSQRLPVFFEMFKREGQEAIATQVQTLDGESLSLPLKRKHLMVFWATWCPPCKVELARINKMIKSGDIDAQKIIAISSGEEPLIVSSFAKENDYRFPVAVDPSGEIAKKYKVSGTPTLLLINEDGKIEWMTMGVSPSLELRLKSFLNE